MGRETIISLLIKMVFWLLCGEWIREGWGGWGSQADKRWSWLATATVVSRDKERHLEILNVLLFKFWWIRHSFLWEAASILINTSQVHSIFSLFPWPPTLLSYGWRSPFISFANFLDCELSVHCFACCCTLSLEQCLPLDRCLIDVFKFYWIGHCASHCAKYYVHPLVYCTQQPYMSFDPHFTDEETKAWRASCLCLTHVTIKCERHGLNPVPKHFHHPQRKPCTH